MVNRRLNVWVEPNQESLGCITTLYSGVVVKITENLSERARNKSGRRQRCYRLEINWSQEIVSISVGSLWGLEDRYREEGGGGCWEERYGERVGDRCEKRALVSSAQASGVKKGIHSLSRRASVGECRWLEVISRDTKQTRVARVERQAVEHHINELRVRHRRKEREW